MKITEEKNMAEEIVIMTSETDEIDIKVQDIAYLCVDHGKLIVTYKNGHAQVIGENADIYLDVE